MLNFLLEEFRIGICTQLIPVLQVDLMLEEPNPLALWNNNKLVKMIRQDGVEFHFGQLVLAQDGNWTMPDKLAVDGKIGAREVVVTQATWSDFVFKDDYRL